jgi:hypothetical protein
LDYNGNMQFDNCDIDRCIGFGLPGDIPIMGDWNGSGTMTIGVFRDGVWFLDYNGNKQFDNCDIDRCIGFGLPGDEPVTGDWDGSGTTKIGVYRNGSLFLDYNGNLQFDDCEIDRCIGFGMPGDFPVTGVWVEDDSSFKFEVPEVLEPAVKGVPYTYSFCQQELPLTSTTDLCGGPFVVNSINPSGGEGPYNFTKDTLGAFPPFGMLLNLNGLLTGKPTIAGPPITFSVCARDSVGNEICREATLEVKAAEPPPTAGVLSVSPEAGLSASIEVGGALSASSKSYAATSASSKSVSLSSTGGFLEPGAITSVTVSINDFAANLGAGIYSDTVFFTNTTNGNGNTSRSVLLTVTAVEPPPPPPQDEVSITFESGSCPVDRFSWGELISLSPETSGSVSGPVGTEFFASGLASADLSCSAWSNCMRSESEPSTTGWTYSGFGVRNENKIDFEANSDFGSKSLTAYVTCPLD